ncbi:hypothetical protein T8A63_14740 [Sulfitobacter sp. OXR-159]|jgi:hypothetical protein|uniref:hypothetical protein n=1 Tax=Sulfitobacter sp. OXR-159 TaxID=3100174 RepID=UPI002AC98ADC|nr:hypothetical protein [Sulfitobacter sp. OXR-159]WPZ28876.1 hypothetical protein T8A63_14740 [Sulfitobacter sp. OXR-159]
MPRDFLSTPSPAAFVLSNAAALCSAALLLGGRDAEARVQRLIDDMCVSSSTTSRVRRELDAMESLLGLEHVHDLDRIEAERFAAIDPMSSVIEEICLLLEGLRAARAWQ